jgi:hypothetical protein
LCGDAVYIFTKTELAKVEGCASHYLESYYSGFMLNMCPPANTEQINLLIFITVTEKILSGDSWF